jgi:7-cyano-7-deazaguanine synthase
MPKKAVSLLSGGLDSATTLAIAISEGFETLALSFLYGQKGSCEVEAAKAVVEKLGAKKHIVLDIALGQLGGSALTDQIPIPMSEPDKNTIPVTYVPARNTIFLSYALALAEVTGARDIFIGANSLDYSGYPDCRPEYMKAFEAMANLATKAGVEGDHITIHAPLQHLNKAEIIRKGAVLGVDFGLTMSCYEPSPQGLACGLCESCRIRLRGFADTGIDDPIPYQTKPERY